MVHSTPLLNSLPAPTVGPNDDDDHDADDDDDRKDGKDEGHSGKGGKRSFSRGLIPRLDADDPGFVDPLIIFSFNFTGTAIYLFGIQPLSVGRPNEPPTNMNLTFTLDNKPAGVFHSTGVPSASGFRANVNVLSMTALEDGAHQLVVSVGRNSIFMFDHLVYTASETSPTSTTDSPTTPLGQNSPSSSISPSTRKHNIATFAGAVGGSVGVLAVFSLCLALSIIRRRRLAAIRDRHERESFYTSGSDDAPHMAGPAPFVPRYFPGTVIPPDPPTYTAALASSHDGSTLSASISSTRYSSAPRSYADVPPSTPPPLLDEADMIPPPPPFPVAIRSPPPRYPSGRHKSSPNTQRGRNFAQRGSLRR
ncbi:hypothetical protein NLJ89_g3368 [Agrocybe chaxingu]|uniref:Uncharacterized protein n=1 Tax=Agrocybe chaxingu TaxID=84603 RepID=A0A9W8K4U5_9AGAR|nr:hypothetical protein NLJ89_g3368 [Agrocybe chaxingu]